MPCEFSEAPVRVTLDLVLLSLELGVIAIGLVLLSLGLVLLLLGSLLGIPMSEKTIKTQVLWLEAAKQSGDIKPWLSGILGAARKQKCHKAVPPMRHCEKIIREPLDKAAEVVAKAVASDGGGSAKGKAVAIPEGNITAASIDEQYDLAGLFRD